MTAKAGGRPGFQSNFMDVLAEELRKDLRADVRAELLAELGLEPAAAARELFPSPATSARERLDLWLSAKFGAKSMGAAKTARSYPKTAAHEDPRPGKAATGARPATDEGPRTTHALDAEDHAALEFFRREGRPLTDDYTEFELKAAYRKLALKLHPDAHAGEDERDRHRWAARFQQLVELTERLGRHCLGGAGAQKAR